MADETSQPNPTSDAPAKSAKGKPWIVYLALTEIVLGVGFVYAFLPSSAVAVDDAWKHDAPVKTRLVPDLIVNLRDEDAKRILRFSAHIKYIARDEDADAAEAAMNAEGVVEDLLVGMMSKKLLSQVQGRPPSIKAELMETLTRVVFREVRRPEGPIEGAEVIDVLFPQWIIQ